MEQYKVNVPFLITVKGEIRFHVEQFFIKFDNGFFMQDIEPFFNWEKYYVVEEDPLSPFHGATYDLTKYTTAIYDHYIHPKWDYMGSETLYAKVLYANYNLKYTIIELFGEWNDALHNDIMHFKRNVLDLMLKNGINQFILIGENVLNFHGSDDCYYEEWFEDVENGWIAAINFQYFVEDQWKKFRIDSYINYGGTLNIDDWRTMTPIKVYETVKGLILRRIG